MNCPSFSSPSARTHHLGEAAEDHDELSVVRTVTETTEDAEVTMVFEKFNHSEAKTKPGNVKTNHEPGTPKASYFFATQLKNP